MKEVPIVPETMSAHKLMKLFMQQKKTIAFVEEIVVYAKDRVEIKWKFKDEFGEVGKVEKDRIFGGADGSGVV